MCWEEPTTSNWRHSRPFLPSHSPASISSRVHPSQVQDSAFILAEFHEVLIGPFLLLVWVPIWDYLTLEHLQPKLEYILEISHAGGISSVPQEFMNSQVVCSKPPKGICKEKPLSNLCSLFPSCIIDCTLLHSHICVLLMSKIGLDTRHMGRDWIVETWGRKGGSGWYNGTQIQGRPVREYFIGKENATGIHTRKSYRWVF